MSTLSRLVLVPLALACAAGAAAADGGPLPGVVQGWDGVLAPGGSVRYVAVSAGGSTAVAAVRVRGGRVARWGSLRGVYGVPIVAYDGTAGGVSVDGRTLVLSTFTSGPGPQAVSRFAVLSTKMLRLRRVVTLHGAYSYDALSPDGSMLYLIEYTSSASLVRYRVRAFDLAAGRLLAGAIVDKREPAEAMQGYPVTRATSSDGGWAYTLYGKNPLGRPFVHALNTRHGAAVCVDLPWRGVGPQGLSSVRMTLEGTRLVLRQPPIGRLAVIDTATFRVQAFRRPVAPGTPLR